MTILLPFGIILMDNHTLPARILDTPLPCNNLSSSS